MTSDTPSAVVTPIVQTGKAYTERMIIRLSKLRLEAEIGAYDIERGRVQPIEISLSVSVDPRAAHPESDLTRVVDYASMAEIIRSVVQIRHYDLLEDLAQAIANALFEDPRITELTLDIDKLKAPHLHDANHVGVSYHRQRDA